MLVSRYQAPWGPMLLMAEGEALVGLRKKEETCDGAMQDATYGEAEILFRAKKWLDAYFAGEKPAPSELPLCLRGTDFQQAVWRELCRIPYGQTTTYGAIARTIARQRGMERMSPQAVGGAVGRNPIGIIVPCHRVIGSDGGLAGYAGGLEIKEWLLRHEGVNIGR